MVVALHRGFTASSPQEQCGRRPQHIAFMDSEITHKYCGYTKQCDPCLTAQRTIGVNFITNSSGWKSTFQVVFLL